MWTIYLGESCFTISTFLGCSQLGDSTSDASSSAKGKLSRLLEGVILPWSINLLPIENWAGLNAGPRSRAKPLLSSNSPNGRGLVAADWLSVTFVPGSLASYLDLNQYIDSTSEQITTTITTLSLPNLGIHSPTAERGRLVGGKLLLLGLQIWGSFVYSSGRFVAGKQLEIFRRVIRTTARWSFVHLFPH